MEKSLAEVHADLEAALHRRHDDDDIAHDDEAAVPLTQAGGRTHSRSASGRDLSYGRGPRGFARRCLHGCGGVLGALSGPPEASEQRVRRGFIGRLYTYPPAPLGPKSPRAETAWLDGLRGVAAFLVMAYHYHLSWWGPELNDAYGAIPGQEWQIWRLPFLRLWMSSGHAMVSIFFVLSGFVLSWSALGYMRQGKEDKILRNTSSAIFRRWMRLYVPCFIVTIFNVVQYRLHIIELTVQRKATIFGQMIDWARACVEFSNPFKLERNNYDSIHQYNWTMWTIPLEFAGSLCVFLLVLATCRLRVYRRRAFLHATVSVVACYYGGWTYWLFTFGVLLADYVREAGGFAKLANSTTARARAGWVVALIAGLYLAGVPEKSPEPIQFGYEWLYRLAPGQHYKELEAGGRFWWSLSGMLIVPALSHLAAWRRPLEGACAQYLGRVSFMLYLTHRAVPECIGVPLRSFLYGHFGEVVWIEKWNVYGFTGTPQGMALIYVISWLVQGSLALLLANWAEILIDAPSTRFARAVDDWFHR